MNEIKIYSSNNWVDYELLDTGEGEKLERFGPYTFVRPFEDAVWKKTVPPTEWANVHGTFQTSIGGSKAGWKLKDIEKKWVMSYKDIKFWATPTPFRHLQFFPEQAAHWDFIYAAIKNIDVGRLEQGKVSFLNLFGYTGIASLLALKAGAEVTHVDASKQSLTTAKENKELSRLSELPMRILEDDVIKFLEREVKRGNKYDAIIMDPPKFGRGPKGETWKIEEKLPRLLSLVEAVLTDDPLFVILTSYNTDSSSLTLGHALRDALKEKKGNVEQGEMCVVEKSTGRAISLAHTAVWKSI